MGGSVTRQFPTVKEVDLQRYMGRWWQHGLVPSTRFGLSFQDPNPTAVMAVYTLAEDQASGLLFYVANTEWLGPSRKVNTAKARAMAYARSQEPGRVRVQFSSIDGVEGSYLILLLGESAPGQPYPWVAVGSDDGSLWLLEREPGIITPELREQIMRQLMSEVGYSRDIIARFKLTPPNPDIVRHIVVDGESPSKAWPRGDDPTADEFNTLLTAQVKWRRFQRNLG
jgi:lipocalin